MNFRFAEPMAFQLFWVLPLLLFCMIFFARRTRAKINAAFGAKVAPFLTRSVSTRRRQIKLALRLLAVTFFVIALARPQMGKSNQPLKSEGIELIIGIDVSMSMLAEDIKPNRLEHAKAEMEKLIDSLGGDKVGLIAFAGSSALLSPLTTDKSALKMFLEGLSTESVETQGTDVNKALKEAKEAFDRGGVDPAENVRVTRVVLLASDGEDHEQGALELAQKITEDGIRVFVMQLGTEKGAPIPIKDDRGFLRGYKRDREGKEIITQAKSSFLGDLAKAGRGKFYSSRGAAQESQQIRADLDRLEKAAFDSELASNYDERYQIFLIIGLLFALLDLLIAERRPEGRIWRGRFEVPKA